MDAWRERTSTGSDTAAPATAAEFKELFEIYIGPDVPTDPDGFLLAEDGSVREPRVSAEEFYGDRVVGMGVSSGRHHISLQGDAEAFEQRTAAIISGHQVLGKGPEAASFESTVVDARYLARLTSPASFRTAFTGRLPYHY